MGALIEKKHVQQLFWHHLRQRHPATALWWSTDAPVDLWPEWSATAFQRERDTWLALSEMTQNLDDYEARSWGRYARLTAGRISAESWRRPEAPVSHLSHLLQALRLVDPDEKRGLRIEVLEGAIRWLAAIEPPAAADYWTRPVLEMEVRQAIRWLRQWPCPQSVSALAWGTAVDRAATAVQAYRDRILSYKGSHPPEVPWMPIAHLDADDWKARRRAWTRSSRPAPGPRPPSFGATRPTIPPPVQLTRTAGGAASWLRPGNGQPVLFAGDTAGLGAQVAGLFAWWQAQAPALHPLSWVLAEPWWVEGGLRLLAEASSPGLLTRWRETMTALALADAWLWLESGDPEEVTRWLTPVCSRHYALAWIPRLKVNPGRILAGEIAADRYRTAPQWRFGPIAPELWPASAV